MESDLVFCWFKKKMMFGNTMLPTVSLAGIPTPNCYKLRKKKRRNEALQSCQSNNSALIDITSLAEAALNPPGDGECRVSLV